MALKLEVVITADDKASSVISKVFGKSGQSAKKFEQVSTKAFVNVQASVSSLIKKIAAISATVASVYKAFDFSKSVIKTADTFEKLRLTLANIEGSMNKARASFAWIQDFTAKTPYKLEEVTSAFVKLKTYGIDPLSNDTLRVAGDVAAAFQGMGKTIDDVVEALADAITGEFERLKEFGIKASSQGEQVIFRYADAHGQVVEKVVENNQEIIRSTLLAIWNDKYGGQMDKLSGTWSQMVSNIQDNWTRFKQLVAESGFFDYMKNNLKTVLDWSNKMFETGQAQKWANVIGKSFVYIAEMIKGVFEVVKTFVSGIYNFWVGAFKGIKDFTKRIFTEEGFFESMIDAFIVSVKTLPKVFVKGIGIISMQVVKWASELFRPVIVAIEWATDNLVRAFKRAINNIKNAFVDLKNWIAEKLSFEKEIFGKKIKFQLFEKTDFKPIFDEVETRYISFKQKVEEVNKEQEELIKNLSKWQSELWTDVKKDYEEALKRIRESGKAGEVIASGIEKYTNGMQNLIEAVSQKIDELKAKGVEGLDEIQVIINKAPEKAKSALDQIADNTKKTTEKMKSFWKDFFDSISKNPFWKKVIEFGKKAWEGIKGAFSGGAKEGETGIIARTKNTIQNIMSGASAGGIAGVAAAFLTDQLMQNEKIRNALDKIFGAIQKILEPIAEVIAPVLEALPPLIESFRPVFKLIAELLKPVAWILRQIASGITKVINFFTSIAKPVWDGMKRALDIIKSIVEAIKKALESAKKGVSNLWDNTIGKVGKAIGRALPFFHDGGMVYNPIIAHNGMYIGNLKADEVPAVLQQGEYVINRQATQKYRPVLQAINEGKDISMGNTNITINIYAQNFDRRFVEDELLPLLEDFHRRGKLRWE